jgi:hypothetical protein
VPLQPPTAPHRAGLARGAIIAAAACIAASGGNVAGSDDQIAMANRSTVVPTGRYHDIEANKADSMRALGLATMHRRFTSPYRDLEANKAQSQRQAR